MSRIDPVYTLKLSEKQAESVIHSHCLAALESLIAGIWLEHTIRASGMIGSDSPVVYVIHDC